MVQQKPIAETIKGAAIQMTVERTGKNPHMADSEKMDHWRITLKCGNDKMRLYFSKGYGHKGAEPRLEEVLDCLASDACGIDNARNFKEWASEYGYSTDNRKAEKTYNTCKTQRDELERLLGPSLYAALLYETERL
jgi:hypothetical protein